MKSAPLSKSISKGKQGSYLMISAFDTSVLLLAKGSDGTASAGKVNIVVDVVNTTQGHCYPHHLSFFVL